MNPRWFDSTSIGRCLTACGVMIVALLGYFALNLRLLSVWDPMTPIDLAIPFLPWTWAIYMSYYPLLLVWSGALEPPEFRRLMKAILVAVAISFTCFWFFPVQYPRPSTDTVGEPWRSLFNWLHDLDGPGNTFPSLHVACAVVLGLGLWSRRGRWGWAIWITLIALSTMTTKQHFLADVIGGTVVAIVGWRLAR